MLCINNSNEHKHGDLHCSGGSSNSKHSSVYHAEKDIQVVQPPFLDAEMQSWNPNENRANASTISVITRARSALCNTLLQVVIWTVPLPMLPENSDSKLAKCNSVLVSCS